VWHGVLQLVEELGHKWQAVAEALGNVRSPVQCKEHWRLLTQQAGAGEEPVVFTPEQLVELKEVRHQGGGWQGEGGHHVYDFDVTSGDGLLAQPLVAVFCLQFMGCSMDLATSNGACNPVALACHARSAVDVPLCRYLHVHTVVAFLRPLSTVHPNLCLTCPPPPPPPVQVCLQHQAQHGKIHWKVVAELFPGRSKRQVRAAWEGLHRKTAQVRPLGSRACWARHTQQGVLGPPGS
jgi:hypothetical protein